MRWSESMLHFAAAEAGRMPRRGTRPALQTNLLGGSTQSVSTFRNRASGPRRTARGCRPLGHPAGAGRMWAVPSAQVAEDFLDCPRVVNDGDDARWGLANGTLERIQARSFTSALASGGTRSPACTLNPLCFQEYSTCTLCTGSSLSSIRRLMILARNSSSSGFSDVSGRGRKLRAQPPTPNIRPPTSSGEP